MSDDQRTDPTVDRLIVHVEEDPETGELVLPLPEEVLEKAGFKPGDVLVWKDEGNGAFSLSKKVDTTEEKDV
jgi:hypothetical protein